jgi:enoyl-CoA hydratase/carnithine racemase
VFETIHYAHETMSGGTVTTITLNRPDKKNAISPGMANELLYALDMVANDPNSRCVVLTGAGGHFCAGGDFTQMMAGPSIGTLPIRGDYADLLLAMIRLPRPIIAKVDGVAMGGGLGLATAAHFCIASETATFATPEINRGLFPMMIMAVLARTVSRRHLMEMMLVGQKFSALEAQRMGLVNRAVAPEHLEREVRSLAETLASRSPTAMSRGLAAWVRQGDLSLAESLPMLRDALYDLLGTDDAREGLMAFMEKRQPRWTGR